MPLRTFSRTRAVLVALAILATCESVDAAVALFPVFTTVLPTAGSSSFALAMSPAAAWTASSSAGWLTVGVASGSGDSVVTYVWTANTSPRARQAQILVAGQSFVVNQLGSTGASTAWGTVSPGQVATIAGTGGYGNTGDGGAATSALFEEPDDVKVDANGNVYISDARIDRVRRVDASTGLITTVAGNGTTTFSGDGGLATSASIYDPVAIALDSAGNIFIADAGNARIRRVDAVSGIITTVVGSGATAFSGDGGPALAAGFPGIAGLAVDGSGNLYISDSSNRVRRVDAVTGIITTVAGNGTAAFSGDGGPATAASLDVPAGLAVDPTGNLFIADFYNARIRRVDAVTGFISTFAGGGSTVIAAANGGAATLALLGGPVAVATDQFGNVYFAEDYNNDVRAVNASTGIITTPIPYVGNTVFTQSLGGPLGLAIDGAGSLYVADAGSFRVRFMDLISPQIAVTPLAALSAASGSSSVAFTISPSNAPWVANASVPWLTLTSATTGSGGATIGYSYTANASVGPRNGAISINGQTVEVIQAGAVLTLSSNPAVISAASSSGTFNITVTPAAAWNAVSSAAWLTVSPPSGSGNGTVTWTAIANPNANARTATIAIGGQSFVVLQLGTTVSYTSWGEIAGITANGNVRTIAGQATVGFGHDNILAIQSYLSGAVALAVDANDNVFIADANRIRRVDAVTGIITTVAGNAIGATSNGFGGDGGPATSAFLSGPRGLAAVGSNLYIADTGNQRIRMIDASGNISTVAGTGVAGFGGDGGPATGAMLNTPRGIAADSYGNIYIADVANARVRRIDAATGTMSTVAGNGVAGFSGDNGPALAAQFNYPNAVATDSNGNIFVADVYNGRIRRVDAVSGQITTVAGDGMLNGSFSNGGSALAVNIGGPQGIAVTPAGDLIIWDANIPRILRVDTQGIITTISNTPATGNNSVMNNVPALTAPFFPTGIAVDGNGDVYVVNPTHVDVIDFSTPALALSITSTAPGPVAGTGSITIGITPANAMWLAASSATWLTIANPTGSGNATVNYSFSANNSFVARSATITIAGVTESFIQAGATASLSANSATVAATGGNATFNLTVTPSVPWTAASSASWLTVSAASGNGSATLSYTWTANTSGAARTARIVVAGQYFSVLQVSAAEGYFPWAANSSYGMIRTIAGNGSDTPLGDGGPAIAASLWPAKTVVDANGNLYITDTSGYRVRRVDATTGLISTVAGNGTPYGENEGGPAISAAIRPLGIALDAAGNLFIADNAFARIRRVDAVTGIITSIAGGSGGLIGDGGLAVTTTLYGPSDLAIDGSGVLYIADGSTVRRIDPVTGIISTVAGAPGNIYPPTGPNGDGGPARQAALAQVMSVAIDAAGDILLAEYYSGRIRKISAATGIITTVAGGGCCAIANGQLATSAATFSTSIAVDPAGNFYDASNGGVYRVDGTTGVLTLVASSGVCCGDGGDGGPATLAQLQSVDGLGIDGSGNLYISDRQRMRVVDFATPQIALGASSAQVGAAAGTGSTSITVAPTGAQWVGASTAPWLTLITTPTGTGSGTLSYSFTANPGVEPRTGTIGVYGQILVVTQAGAVTSISPGFAAVTSAAGSGSIALTSTAGITWQSSSGAAWVMVTQATGSGNATIGYNFTANTSQAGRSAVLTIAGQSFTLTQLGASGNYSPWATSVNGQINTIAGNGTAGFTGDGAAAVLAELNQPHGIAVDGTGAVYFADTTNNRIRRVDPVSGIITTVGGSSAAGFAGDGGLAAAASFSQPNGLAIDSSGNLYIADAGNNRIRRIDAVTGFVSTVAGNGVTGTAGTGGLATSANLNAPAGMATDAAGNLFISDTNNNRILRVDGLTGILLPWVGTGVTGNSGDGASALLATLNLPTGIAIDAAGNLYIADSGNRTIRRVDAAARTISTIAGGGTCCSLPTDGIAATLVQLSNPTGVQTDVAGNVYVADTGGSRVRRIDVVTGIISTAAGNGTPFDAAGDGGPATLADVWNPAGIAVNATGLYIADRTSRIRFVDLATPQVTLSPAAASVGVSAESGSVSISVVPAGSPWVASSNAAWLSLTTTSGTGNGVIGYTFTDNNSTSPRLGIISVYGQTANVVQTGAAATLSSTSAIVPAMSGSGTVSLTTGAAMAWTATSSATWLTVGAPGGTGSGMVTWNYTANTSVNARQATLQIAGKVFSLLQLGTTGNYTAWGSSSYGVIRSLVAGTTFNSIVQGVAVDSNDNVYFSQPYSYTVQRLNSANGSFSTVAGSGRCCFPGDLNPASIQAINAEFGSPADVAVDPAGNVFFIETTFGHNIFRVDAVTGLMRSLSTTPTNSIAVDSLGNLYFTNQATNSIQVLNALTGLFSTAAGNGVAGFSGDSGPAPQAMLNHPTSVAVDASGNLFIADSGNFRIRRVDAITGLISTVAGSGAQGFAGDGGAATSASFGTYLTVAVDPKGDVFISDENNFRIRRVDSVSGIITTVVGTGSQGFIGDGNIATSASISVAGEMAFDGAGNLYFDDLGNSVIRFVDFSTPPVTPATAPPTSDSVSPNAVSGTNQSITLNYSSAGGFGNLQTVEALINSRIDGRSACYVFYVQATNSLYLSNKALTGTTGPLAPGTSATLANSACILSGAGSSVTGSGNTLSLTLSVSFLPGVAGAENIYGLAKDNAGQDSGWINLGTWTIPQTSQTISFAALPNVAVGSAAFPLSATASSGLQITLTSNTPAVCSVNGIYVSILSSGGCSITASQSGSTGYLAAAPITQKFTVFFTDVDPGDSDYAAINAMAQHGITAGCATNSYCPNLNVTRDEMAIFIVRAIYGSDNFTYTTTPYFTDVTPSTFGFKWIQKLKDLGITNGCGVTTYCPGAVVARDQMAVFIIRARLGLGIAGPTPTFSYPSTPYFTDAVAGSEFAFPWIQRMKLDRITNGCTATTYCSTDAVTRGQVAIFIMRGAFNQFLPAGTPVISSISPGTLPLGSSGTFTVTGVNTNFVQGTTVVSPIPGVTIGAITVTSPTSLTVQMTAASNAIAQPYSILAITGSEEDVLPNGLVLQ